LSLLESMEDFYNKICDKDLVGSIWLNTENRQ
jgi:hypothetical protein